MALKENYKDDILDTSQNVKRKYRMTENPDGTVSFDDETVYTQEGDSFGASDMNAVNSEVNEVVNNLGAKNMLPNNATSQVVAGITYTINSDGSITISGTSTASNGIVLSSNQLLPKGTYKTTTGQAQEEGTDAFVYVQDANTQRVISRSNDFEVPSQFTLANDTLVNYGAWIDVGKTVNVTIYPMVRPASIADDTYAPYAQTNKELTDNLNGFKYYPTGTQLVAYIEGHGWYKDVDGKYVIWGTATANALVEASPNTYYGRQSEEDLRGEVGADTATPFSGKVKYAHGTKFGTHNIGFRPLQIFALSSAIGSSTAKNVEALYYDQNYSSNKITVFGSYDSRTEAGSIIRSNNASSPYMRITDINDNGFTITSSVTWSDSCVWSAFGIEE